jgi:hypothetical protein
VGDRKRRGKPFNPLFQSGRQEREGENPLIPFFKVGDRKGREKTL